MSRAFKDASFRRFHSGLFSRRAGERGMVLVMALWILAALSLLALLVSQAVSLSSRQASAFKTDAKAGAFAKGAVFAVMRELSMSRVSIEKPGLPSSADSQGDAARRTAALARGEELGFYLVDFDGWKVSKSSKPSELPSDSSWAGKDYAVCLVSAEDAKAPAGALTKAGWGKIPAVSEEKAAKVAEFIKSRGGSLRCLEELLQLKELQGAAFEGSDGLKSCVTAFSGGKLYVNRASETAFAAVFELERSKAAALAAAVKNGSFFMDMKSLEDAVGLSSGQLERKASLSCSVYRIKAYAVSGGKARILEAVVELKSGGEPKLLYMGGV